MPSLWLRHYPKWPALLFGALVLSAALAVGVHRAFAIGAGLLAVMNLLYWVRVREHFRSGCANPAVVIALDPMLIAVSTNLSMVGGEYPVVKIIQKEIPSVCGQLPQVGTRLVTVSLYKPNLERNATHWADFMPRPVDCATTNLPAIIALKNTFTNDDWKELSEALKQVPRPYRPGLFRVGPGA